MKNMFSKTHCAANPTQSTAIIGDIGPATDGFGTAMTDQHQHGAGSGIPDPFEI